MRPLCFLEWNVVIGEPSVLDNTEVKIIATDGRNISNWGLADQSTFTLKH
jgi:hypothetical protein